MRPLAGAALPAPWFERAAEVLLFRAGYNTAVVLLGATLLGVAAGVAGCFVLLRKRALIGDALAHATLPGIALAFLIAGALGFDGRSVPVLLAGAAATGALGGACVLAVIRATRLPEDAAIGAVLSVFFGAGIVLVQVVARQETGNQGGLTHFILGQTAAMRAGDAALFGGIALAAVALAAALFKELRLVCFDSGFAAAQGWPIAALDLAMLGLVVLVIIAGLQAVGLILVVALLIIPAAAARFWTERLSVMVPAAGAIGGASGYLGAAASALLPRMPAGAVIVLTAGAMFGVSLLLAPRRGLLARALRRAALHRRIRTQHLLRALYEQAEHAGFTPAAAPTAARRGDVARLRRAGWVEHAGEGLRLTPDGRREAARLTRNHRLWKEYLVRFAEIAPSHVDWSADAVEHVLTPELIAELERSLGARSGDAEPPPSVHPIGAAASSLPRGGA